ncbi:hypothetical protein OQJ18_13730 [Fluoribacter dumoffii]|uniref:Uncharacterized protein n=1 Tax=Fluoribacter dumoffii TaxID=463 RepID=A0A377GDN6_9GAMM|nr:hypothetical protein [Fluoribacter dumoffii]KTC91220.1 hypothetical protein Ldum_2288 [Fluoribacter dumoffii NY 23]MCW8387612.1 hypothetical protein [Fluoribacter dumoffii]MCW8416843.1 hypothetical protein [Fluoribacter dumoffii]MCW8455317.1 hypothetical protein [Fluoribacter dumoffii]MCW8460605.1 hypothetical protein [Fluoribacter dumoffii]
MSNLEKIVTDLIQAITAELEDKTQDNTSALNKIKNHVNKAFSSVEKGEEKKLYIRLSLHLHPDKLRQAQPKMYELLMTRNALEKEVSPGVEKVKLQDEIFKIISAGKEESDLLKNLESDPLKTAQYVWDKFSASFNYHFNLSERYYWPFKSIVNAASWAINVALILTAAGVFVGGIVIYALISMVGQINNSLCNLFTGGQFAKTIDDYKKEPARFSKAEEQFLATVKNDFLIELQEQLRDAPTDKKEEISEFIEKIQKMSPGEMKEYYLLEKTNKEIDNNASLKSDFERIKEKKRGEFEAAVRNQISIDDLTLFKLQASAIKRSITAPLPAGFFNKIGSLFIVRPLTFLLAPVFLTITSAVSLVQQADLLLGIASMFLLLGVKLASVALLNSPIYGLDLAKWAANHLKAAFDGKKPDPRKEVATPVQNEYPNVSSRLLIENMPTREARIESSPMPPVQSANSFFSINATRSDFEYKDDAFRQELRS